MKSKQYFVECTTDVFQSNMYNPNTKKYGSFEKWLGGCNSVKTAKSYISKAKKELADINPRDFKVYDSFADICQETNHVPVVYQVD